ncbi:WD40-repeat-containing domain protein [Suillus discolor]|uniref:WD40-repeat-containing domain protein n=1 Tax=Suillus discolor TaxID=1912936 RepID=A0A9P7JQW0_9AGAM|nr:WD40-repeat-containing domain protein [Suillus discolor]KAG2100147.1 WD40-repeat-containing domain protein [Suillus discolor]
MLALVTTTALALTSPVTLKNPPSFLPITQPLLSQYIASAWSPDNSSLYLASPFSIDRFMTSQSRLDKAIYVQSREESEINTMAVTPSGNIVLGVGRKVVMLEYAAGSAKVLKTLESHGTTITALVVSNDSMLIASASSKGVHIHNLLVPAKHTSLPLPTSAPRSVSTMTFHPHVRTRLLLGLGHDILVYDVDKPSAPVKCISIGRDVVGIACSPFSKTLVAVASTNSVSLVDLDKDKGLFKTVLSPELITSITFSPEGAAIYLGMRDGLRILNLRELDKEMKRVSVGETGQGVLCLAVQKRLKTASAVKPSISNPANSSPVRARAKVASSVRSPLRPVTAAYTLTSALRSSVSTSRENIFDDASDTPMRSNTRAASSQKSRLLGIHAHPAEIKRERTRVASGSSTRSEITRTSSNLIVGTRTKGSSLKRAPARSKTPANEDEDARTEISSPDLPIDPLRIVVEAKTEGTETGSTGLNVIGTAKSRGSKDKGKGKEVNVDAEDVGKYEELNAAEKDEEEAQVTRERELSMQVSPRRPVAQTWVPSPLRRNSGTFPMQSGASDQNHADIKALHVDMLRMGRGLRQEMEEWGGEVKKLREENQRLRRGY